MFNVYQELLNLSEREGLAENPDYETAPVHWIAEIDDQGDILKLEQNDGLWEIPRRLGKRSGPSPKANFFCDMPAYTLGLALEKDFDTQKLQTRMDTFRTTVEACAESTQDRGAQALLRCLRKLSPGNYRPPEDMKSNHFVGFALQGTPGMLTDRPAIKKILGRIPGPPKRRRSSKMRSYGRGFLRRNNTGPPD